MPIGRTLVWSDLEVASVGTGGVVGVGVISSELVKGIEVVDIGIEEVEAGSVAGAVVLLGTGTAVEVVKGGGVEVGTFSVLLEFNGTPDDEEESVSDVDGTVVSVVGGVDNVAFPDPPGVDDAVGVVETVGGRVIGTLIVDDTPSVLFPIDDVGVGTGVKLGVESVGINVELDAFPSELPGLGVAETDGSVVLAVGTGSKLVIPRPPSEVGLGTADPDDSVTLAVGKRIELV